jgi:hypothetical protein
VNNTTLKPVALVFQLADSPLPAASCFAIREERNAPKPNVQSLPDVDMPDVHEAMMAAIDAYTESADVYSECFTDDELRKLETLQFVFAYKPLVDQDTLARALEADGFVVARTSTVDHSVEALTRHLASTSAASVRPRLPFHAARVAALVRARLIATPSIAEAFVAAVEDASRAWSAPMNEAFVAVGARALTGSFGSSSKGGPPALARSASVRDILLAWMKWFAASLESVETTSLLRQWNEAFVIRALVTGALDVVGDAGVTPLWHAARFGQCALAARLLEAGARVDAHDADQIDRAAGDMRVVSLWRGVPEPGHPAPVGVSSILHAAVSHAGQIELDVVRLLLDHGVAVDGRDAHGDTPLHVAVSNAPTAVLELLLDRGADPNALDRWGRAPLDFADIDNARLLLARGADPNGGPGTEDGRKSEAWSIVESAAYAGNVELLELVLAAGARPEQHSQAMPLARRQDQRDSVRVLMKYGFQG